MGKVSEEIINEQHEQTQEDKRYYDHQLKEEVVQEDDPNFDIRLDGYRAGEGGALH